MYNNYKSDWNNELSAGSLDVQNNANWKGCRRTRMNGSSARRCANRCGSA